MNFLFEPSIYNISYEDWNKEEIKDDFLQKLLKIFDFLDLHTDIILLWSDELDEIMWMSPQSPPWRINKDFKNVFIPVIFKKLSKIKMNIDINHSFTSCIFNPEITYNLKYDDAFKNIFSQIVKDEIDVNLILSEKQIKRDETNIICESPEKNFNCTSINKIAEIIRNQKFIDFFWPVSINNKKQFEDFINSLFINLENKFIFEDKFIRDLINEKNSIFKLKIIQGIYKRLQLNTVEAKNDISLQEEELNNNILRIRITPRPSSLRIHLKVSNKTITFLEYFNSSEHDKGL